MKDANNFTKNTKKIRNDESTNDLLLTTILNKLNRIYKQNNKFEYALKYILEAYEIAKKAPEFPQEVLLLYSHNLAGIYKALEKLDNAVFHYEESIDISIDLLKANRNDLMLNLFYLSLQKH